jgi:RNA polymerase sigma-70 factor (ECF subfamily)
MKLRKRKSDRSVPLDEPVDTGEDTVVREIAVWDDNPEQQYSREELGRILDEAVESLRPAFRTVLVLRDIEELSYQEIGAILRIPDGTVKSRINRGRVELARYLQKFRPRTQGLST